MGDTLHVTVAIFSVILSIAAFILCLITIHRFNYSVKRPISTLAQKMAAQRETRYFQITLRLSSICNFACCASVSLYCVWIISQPQQPFEWFLTLRVSSTVFWFLAKASLIWLYNGRLYFAFNKANFQTSFCQFVFVNALIAAAAPILIVCGFLGVSLGKFWMISFGFEGYRLLFMLLAFYLLFAFHRKLSMLKEYEKARQCRYGAKVIPVSIDGAATTTTTISTEREEAGTAESPQEANELTGEKEMASFIKMGTQNAVSVLFVALSAALVALCWILFNYVFEQNHWTLLLPLNMFAVDSVIDSVCIYMTFVLLSGE